MPHNNMPMCIGKLQMEFSNLGTSTISFWPRHVKSSAPKRPLHVQFHPGRASRRDSLHPNSRSTPSSILLPGPHARTLWNLELKKSWGQGLPFTQTGKRTLTGRSTIASGRPSMAALPALLPGLAPPRMPRGTPEVTPPRSGKGKPCCFPATKAHAAVFPCAFLPSTSNWIRNCVREPAFYPQCLQQWLCKPFVPWRSDTH